MATKTTTTKKSPSYSIGQIVYILSNKSQSIIPAMIVERMLVERLSGNAVSWKLAMGKKGNPQKPQKIEDSRNIDGEIYASLDEIKAVLQAKLAKFIDDITASAKRRTLAWYGDDLQKVGKKQKAKSEANEKIDPDELLEDLEANGGTLDAGIAHVQSAAQDQSNLSEDAQKADVQARLKDMATMTDEDVAAEEVEDGQRNQTPPAPAGEEENSTPMGFIIDPDGNRVPVNLKV